MTVYDNTNGIAARPSASALDKVYVVEAIFDGSVQNLAAGDSVKLIHLPAKHVVLQCVAEIGTAEGTTNKVVIGTSSNDDAYINEVDLTQASGTLTKNAAHADETGINAISASADGIYLKAGDEAIDSAVVKIRALIADMGGNTDTLI
jgi:DNA-binding NarL/FixJ family response regulator